ncbi:MmgE/PrpD family protein [Devosia faecipullorum]|uniref:MmgE/PrpD family protein n=1 Tax=Devosia faecipullorum TaxID=2755039 RepID=UPI00187BA9B0|nr:MmgE/PrpD family protein [Devosia faecipullorum]MBE7732829.1 MmgE/PrpD family protein [Devosia faecipullorum]
MSDTISARIAAFAVAAASDPVPPEVAERARHCVIDHLHAALQGTNSQTAAILNGYDGAAGAEALALRLGALSTVYEIDDVHRDTSMHPGSTVVAAALAAALDSKADDARLLAAVAAGYEVAIRLSVAAGERHYHYHQSTATCGTIAAAVAASIVYGLDAEQTKNAIGLSATMASGLWEDINNAAIMVKHLHSGFAAERGVRAARLAALGMNAASRAIEGPKGFLAALARQDAAYPLESTLDEAALRKILTEGLGERWSILRNIYKRYPFCLGCFEPLEGMRHVLSTSGRAIADIEGVTIEIYPPTAQLVGNRAPTNQLQAKFSAVFAIALLLAGRDPENVLLPVEWLSAPDVVAWYPKIQCLGNGSLRPRSALVNVTWKDGTTTLGNEPLRSLDENEVLERFAGLVRRTLGDEAAGLEARLARLGTQPSSADLTRMVVSALTSKAVETANPS